MKTAQRVRHGARTTGLLGAVVTALVGALLVVTGGPATAMHQYCGEAAEGVHLGGYAGGSKDNGHPDGKHGGWAGGSAVGEAKNLALIVNRVGASIGMSATIYDTLAYDTPNKAVKLAFSIAKLAAGIAGTATNAAVLALEQRNAEVNACNSVLAGDTIDLLFVARMQEELAQLDPADGNIDVPSSMFLLPDDGSPNWTDFATRYGSRPGHSDLAIPYIDGFANTDAIGVATIVRNTIAHLDAHGIDTGGGYEWTSDGLEYQNGAKDLWWDAMRLLEDGRVRLAYAKFADAYRMAVTTQTTS